MVPTMKKPIDLLLQLLLLLLIAFVFTSDAKLACLSNEECEESIRVGSKCVDGFCSNPFTEGCLKTMLGEKDEDELFDMKLSPEVLGALNGRVCNSDDDDEASFCVSNEFDYFEIRIHNANWESSIFLAWIMQIMLMEVMKVPVTIGLNSGVTNITSFYSPINSLEYSAGVYPWDALRQKVGCETTEDDCVDVLPEVWNSQVNEWTNLMQDGAIDSLDWCGQVGKLGWYIPTSTARKDDSLLSHYGLQGEKNRAKLAQAFKRPSTWSEYCEEVSSNNCTVSDEFAEQYPGTDSRNKYFVDGLYKGFFRMLPENNCTEFPDTCTGYIVGPPCSWSTNVDAQLYWNDIVGLKMDGPEEPNGAYGYGSMVEIWKAANATQSDVLMWWWQPEAMLQKFSGTGWSFQQVVLPTVTNVCSKARVTSADRCSADIMVRRGDPMGACDDEAHALLKIISSKLPERTIEVEEIHRSPAYPFIRALKVTDLEIQSMLNSWIGTNVDTYGNDAREVVCSWVVDNMDSLVDFIPRGHPRTLDQQGSFQQGYVYFATAVAALCFLVLVAVAVAVHRFRLKKVFVYAQEIFVKIILLGFLLIVIGGSLYAAEPTKATCIARSWLTNMGFSTVLSAVLVKMSTINRIMQKSKKCKRVKVPRQAMFGSLSILVMIDVIILIAWTVVSPPQAIEELVLPEEFSTTVESSLICRSNLIIFQYLIDAWHLLLLIVASVLSFQSRDIVPAFNESRSIGTMIYSNFLFMIIRLIVLFLGQNGLIASNIFGASMCILYVLDTLIATAIYIAPKCYKASKDTSTHVSRGSAVFSAMSMSAFSASGGFSGSASGRFSGSGAFSANDVSTSSLANVSHT